MHDPLALRTHSSGIQLARQSSMILTFTFMIKIMRYYNGLCLILMMVAVLMTGVFGFDLRHAVRRADVESQDWENSSTSVFNHSTPQYDYISPSRDFPICIDLDTPLVPFCLPHDGADVFVDATYYVTWNADFYPLNATITIELRYSDSTEGDSAFTSARVDNSYGYVPIHMSGEWLQGKSQNALTLYIIELEPASDRRASAQQGPTITLHTKPVERYRHPPPLPFNKVALYIGLPVSLGVVISVVAGLFFGMRESRRIGIGNIMGSRGKGYGIRKSKFERLGQESNDHRPESFAILKKQYEDQVHWPFPETAQRDDDLECRPSDVEREASRPNSWRLR